MAEEKLQISPLVRLLVQVAALAITGGGTAYSLRADMAGLQANLSVVQETVTGVKQQVQDTQAEVVTLGARVDNLTNSLLGSRTASR